MKKITIEDVTFLCTSIGEAKYLKRQDEFEVWISDFVQAVQTFEPQTPILIKNGLTIKELAINLNYNYWNIYKEYVRKYVYSASDTENDQTLINHYKIASTIEFVISETMPFLLNEKENDLLNAKLACHITLRIIFSWNKEQLDMAVVADHIKHDYATRKFFEEHQTWLVNHGASHQSVIFSNMQTIRLLHYWLKEPKNGVMPLV